MIAVEKATDVHKAQLLVLVCAEYAKVFLLPPPSDILRKIVSSMDSAEGEVVLVDNVVVAGYLLDENSLVTYVLADGYKKSVVWLILTQALLDAIKKYEYVSYKKLSPLIHIPSKVCKNGKIYIKDLAKGVARGAKIWGHLLKQ